MALILPEIEIHEPEKLPEACRLLKKLGKSAQTVGIELNIKASDTWNFFQAKTIRQTTLRTAAEALQSRSQLGPTTPTRRP